MSHRAQLSEKQPQKPEDVKPVEQQQTTNMQKEVIAELSKRLAQRSKVENKKEAKTAKSAQSPDFMAKAKQEIKRLKASTVKTLKAAEQKAEDFIRNIRKP